MVTPRLPSRLRARVAQSAAATLLLADLCFFGFAYVNERAPIAPGVRGSSDWWTLAIAALLTILLALGARLVAPVAYLVWLHGAFGRALGLARDRELARFSPASAVGWAAAPVVQFITGLQVQSELDALSRSGVVGRVPAWVAAGWWGALSSIWLEASLVGAVLAHADDVLLGLLMVASIALRWLSVPVLVVSIERLERVQRERADRPDWAAVF